MDRGRSNEEPLVDSSTLYFWLPLIVSQPEIMNRSYDAFQHSSSNVVNTFEYQLFGGVVQIKLGGRSDKLVLVRSICLLLPNTPTSRDKKQI